MGSRILKWTAYAIAVTLLLSWTYILLPHNFTKGGISFQPGEDDHSIVKDTLKREGTIVGKEKKTIPDIVDQSPKFENSKIVKEFSYPTETINIAERQPKKKIPIEDGAIYPLNKLNNYKQPKTNIKIMHNPSKSSLVREKSIQNRIISRQHARRQAAKKFIPESRIKTNINSYKEVNLINQPSVDSTEMENNDRYKQVMLDQAENSNVNWQQEKVEFTGKELRDIELDMLKRREQVKNTCYRYGLGRHAPRGRKTLRYPPSANYDVLYIDRADALTWCPVYKAASTTWLYLMSQLAGAKESMLDTTKDQISTVARRLYPPMDNEEAEQAVVQTTKFMIVRHPFERLVSAYRDKLENLNIGREHGVQHFYDKFGKKIVQKYRDKSLNRSAIYIPRYSEVNSNLQSPRGVEPTFSEFVRYLIDTDLVHHSDDHWIPYYLFCTPCYIDYDVIVKFETIERDQKYLIHKLKLEDKVYPKWKHLTKGRQTAEVVNQYMATLTKTEVSKLFQKYRVDFEMYNYGRENYK